MEAFLKAGWPGLVAALVASVGLLGAASAALAAPSNDDFAQARSLRVGTTVKGSITGATKQRGEPRHANSAARHSVWYRLQTIRKRAIALGTCKANVHTALAVYTGRALRTLREVEFNNGGCGDHGSRVTFTARPGRTYWIAVAGFDRRGSFRLRVASVAVPRNDDFVDAVPIRLRSSVAGTTRNATRELREAAYLDYPQTVWFRFRVARATRVRLAACNGVKPGIAIYTGRRVDRLTRVRFNSAAFFCAVQFRARRGVTYRIALESGSYGTRSGRFRLRASIPNPPSNDNFADATPITLGTTVSGTTHDATSEPDEPRDVPLTVWYRFRLTEETGVTVDNCAGMTLKGSVMVIYEGTQMDELNELSHFSCSDPYTTLPRGVYRLQVQASRTSKSADFSFRLQGVAPPP